MAAESDGILVLQGAKPLARGNQRTVYAHPSDPDLLIKLPRSYWNKKGERWYKRLRSARSALQREAAEHAALKARSPADLDLIETVRDWVTTDLGPGLAVGALRD